MEKGRCKEKDGYLKGSLEHIIFSGVELGKKFHGVNTSQAAVNTFLAMAITFQILWFM